MSESWIITVAVLIVFAILLLMIFVGNRKKKQVRSINSFIERGNYGEAGVAQEWLKINGLTDDTYINLLFKCYRLDKPIRVKSITVDNDSEEVTVCFTVPNTENSITVTMDFDEIEFQIGGPNDKTKQAWLFFDLDLWSELPIYDEDTQIPVDHIDWKFVVENITSIKLYVSEEQYRILFPEVTI